MESMWARMATFAPSAPVRMRRGLLCAGGVRSSTIAFISSWVICGVSTSSGGRSRRPSAHLMTSAPAISPEAHGVAEGVGAGGDSVAMRRLGTEGW